MAGKTKSQNAVLDQVIKLLTLSENEGATESEAQNALAMARRLMLKHGIEESTVDSKKKGVDKPSNRVMSRPEGSPRFQPWELSLADVIAGYFGARCLMTHDRTSVMFYGFGEDAKIAEHAFNQVLRTVWDLALQYVRDHQVRMKAKGYSDMRRLPPGFSLRSVRDAYVLGVLVGFASRLDEEKKKDTPEETAIVLSRDQKLTDYIDEEIKPTSSNLSLNSNVKNHQAFNSGYDAGHEIQIHSGIEESQKDKLE